MNNQKIIQMASAIRATVESVTVRGTESMTQLLGIARTADAILAEARKEESDGQDDHV